MAVLLGLIVALGLAAYALVFAGPAAQSNGMVAVLKATKDIRAGTRITSDELGATQIRAADPSLHTFVFSGDGCWRLYGGGLAEAANIGMNLFIVNNGTYAIVDKGLEVVIPDVDKGRYHGKLAPIDFVAAAKAQRVGRLPAAAGPRQPRRDP